VIEENLEAIEKAEYDYLVGVKLRGMTEFRDKALCPRGRFQIVDESLDVKDVMLDGCRDIICRNPEESEADCCIMEGVVAKLTKGLSASSVPQKKDCSIITHLVKKRFVRRLKSGRIVLNKGKIVQERRYDGKYVLLTTDRKLEASEFAL